VPQGVLAADITIAVVHGSASKGGGGTRLRCEA
jgi:hypothetical protein